MLQKVFAFVYSSFIIIFTKPFKVICRNFVSFRYRTFETLHLKDYSCQDHTQHKVPPYELFLNGTIFTTPVKIIKNPFVLVKMQDIHTQERTTCYSFVFLYIKAPLKGCNEQRFKPPKRKFHIPLYWNETEKLNVNRWFVWVGDNLMGIVREFQIVVVFATPNMCEVSHWEPSPTSKHNYLMPVASNALWKIFLG